MCSSSVYATYHAQRAAGIGPDPICHIRFGSGSDAFSSSFFRHRKWPGSSLSDPDRIRLCTSGPAPISMRYRGSAWTERSQIRAASGSTDRDHIRHFYSEPDGHRLGSIFTHLVRFRYRCVIPVQLGLNEARSDPPPAKQIGTTSDVCIPGRMVIDRSE